MRIGVMGAPGAGKSKFARRLKKELGGMYQAETWKIIDAYVEKLQKSTYMAYGRFGNYVDNFQVAFKRRELELAHSNTITCGTIVDTNAYAFMIVEPNVDDEFFTMQYQRIEALTRTLAIMYVDTWDYDYAFYLPTEDELGYMIRTACETFQTPAIYLDRSKTVEGQVKFATETIRAIESANAADPDQSGTEPGDTDGTDERDSVGSVPDVPQQA